MDLRSVEYFSQDGPVASGILIFEHVNPREMRVLNLGYFLVQHFVGDLPADIITRGLIVLGIIFKKSNFLLHKELKVLVAELNSAFSFKFS